MKKRQKRKKLSPAQKLIKQVLKYLRKPFHDLAKELGEYSGKGGLD